MKFWKFRLVKGRGRTWKYYFFVSAFGVASAFYILKPVIDEIEGKIRKAEQQQAVEAIVASQTKKQT